MVEVVRSLPLATSKVLPTQHSSGGPDFYNTDPLCMYERWRRGNSDKQAAPRRMNQTSILFYAPIPSTFHLLRSRPTAHHSAFAYFLIFSSSFCFSRSLPPLILYFTSLPPTFYFFSSELFNKPSPRSPCLFLHFFSPIPFHTYVSVSLPLSLSLSRSLSLLPLSTIPPLFISLSDSSSPYHEYLSLYLSFYIDYLPEN